MVGCCLQQDFIPRLQDHLLSRLRNPNDADRDVSYSDAERGEVTLYNDRIFQHATMRLNYTTYDVRREEETISPRTRPNVMVPSPDINLDTGTSISGHPFAYARVLAIFHAEVMYSPPGTLPKQHVMEFLWVHWFRLDSQYKAGFKHKRLYRLELIPTDDATAFSFLNPDDVIRGSHLIPSFAHGKTQPVTARQVAEWQFHYVNM